LFSSEFQWLRCQFVGKRTAAKPNVLASFDEGFMAINIEELLSLPAIEQLRLANLLWENVRESDAVMQLPQSEWDEIFRREEHMKAHPEEWMTAEQMWSRVDELRKK
jgi:putative addiction module component (TIGR02574 family)